MSDHYTEAEFSHHEEFWNYVSNQSIQDLHRSPVNSAGKVSFWYPGGKNTLTRPASSNWARTQVMLQGYEN